MSFSLKQKHTMTEETTSWRRFPAVMPFAAILTIGLMSSMAGLIASEFEPQEKSEALEFEINPVERIVELDRVIDEPDPYEKVDVPPPPPMLEITRVASVDVPNIPVSGAVPVFEMRDITLHSTTFVMPDAEETPLVRIPPVMPSRFQSGNVSGYCQMQFSIGPNGQVFNAEAKMCTHPSLSRPSVKSVLQWKYSPKTRDGQPMTRTGVQTRIRFELADGDGRLLPLPSGF